MFAFICFLILGYLFITAGMKAGGEKWGFLVLILIAGAIAYAFRH